MPAIEASRYRERTPTARHGTPLFARVAPRAEFRTLGHASDTLVALIVRMTLQGTKMAATHLSVAWLKAPACRGQSEASYGLARKPYLPAQRGESVLGRTPG